MNSIPALPRMPALFSRSLKRLPPALLCRTLERALNLFFAGPIRRGDLDFLLERRIRIELTDAPIHFVLSLRTGAVVVEPGAGTVDLEIAGTAYAFLLLASRAEDADTLFFHRQLHVQGDTELGLEVKNFLDGLDLSEVPLHGPLEVACRQGLRLADGLDRLWHLLSPVGERGARNR